MFLRASLWNTISAIRVAYIARHAYVVVPTTNYCIAVLEQLKIAGAISSFIVYTKPGNKKTVKVTLAYIKHIPAVSNITVVTKQSSRVYIKASALCQLLASSCVGTIVSTSSGIMQGKDACERKLGGELLIYIHY